MKNVFFLYGNMYCWLLCFLEICFMELLLLNIFFCFQCLKNIRIRGSIRDPQDRNFNIKVPRSRILRNFLGGLPSLLNNTTKTYFVYNSITEILSPAEISSVTLSCISSSLSDPPSSSPWFTVDFQWKLG